MLTDFFAFFLLVGVFGLPADPALGDFAADAAAADDDDDAFGDLAAFGDLGIFFGDLAGRLFWLASESAPAAPASAEEEDEEELEDDDDDDDMSMEPDSAGGSTSSMATSESTLLIPCPGNGARHLRDDGLNIHRTVQG